MVCPYCFFNKTEVYNSRSSKKTNSVWRRRKCLSCQKQFTTQEYVEPATVLTVQADRAVTPFSMNKLTLSILRSCDHRVDLDKSIAYVSAIVLQELLKSASKTSGELSKAKITETIAIVLKRFDTVAYIKYMSYHNGPLETNLKRQLKI